jgi:hypothetical protein
MNKEKLLNWWKSFTKGAGQMFHKIGFWFLILVIAGTILGGSAMSLYQKSRMNEAIMLGGLVFDNKVYNITERIR